MRDPADLHAEQVIRSVTAESERVADGNRAVFGRCTGGLTDLHVFALAGGNRESCQVTCVKCGEGWQVDYMPDEPDGGDLELDEDLAAQGDPS